MTTATAKNQKKPTLEPLTDADLARVAGGGKDNIDAPFTRR